MTKREKRQWWIWAITTAAAVVAVVALWVAPVEIKGYGADPGARSCGTFTHNRSDAGLGDVFLQMQMWAITGEGGGRPGELYDSVTDTEKCERARENRLLAVVVAAIGAATLIIVTRPSDAARPEPADRSDRT